MNAIQAKVGMHAGRQPASQPSSQSYTVHECMLPTYNLRALVALTLKNCSRLSYNDDTAKQIYKTFLPVSTGRSIRTTHVYVYIMHTLVCFIAIWEERENETI